MDWFVAAEQTSTEKLSAFFQKNQNTVRGLRTTVKPV